MSDLTRAIAEALGCRIVDAAIGRPFWCEQHAAWSDDGVCPEVTRIAAAITPLIKARVREAQADVWDETAEEAYGWGWLHDWGLIDVKERNPYRDEESNA